MAGTREDMTQSKDATKLPKIEDFMFLLCRTEAGVLPVHQLQGHLINMENRRLAS